MRKKRSTGEGVTSTEQPSSCFELHFLTCLSAFSVTLLLLSLVKYAQGKVYIHLHAVVQEANLQHIVQVGLWRARTRTQARVRTHAKHIILRSLSLAVLD